MCKLEHYASCLLWLLIVGYSLFFNKASLEMQYEWYFPGEKEVVYAIDI